jgi:AAA15 family ATPase/GTPase
MFKPFHTAKINKISFKHSFRGLFFSNFAQKLYLMLENIHIQNFRCFEDFKAEGFERINLIGGMNNSGKTCLLEAILCLNDKFQQPDEEHEDQYVDIAKLRGEKLEDLLNQELRIGTKIAGSIKITANTNKSAFSKHTLTLDINKPQDTRQYSTNTTLKVFYISQTKCLPKIDFDDIFYRVEVEERTKDFVDVLTEIDPSITYIRTIGRDGMRPKIKQLHNRNYINLNSFGDAIKNVMRYFSPIIEREVFEKDISKEYILLIDEIENGLHYTAHYEFWKKIFSACKKLNIQIFATTHSLEMIQQFNKVAKEEGEAAYFEMGREYGTEKIFAFKHDTELLEYELEKTTSTIRG